MTDADDAWATLERRAAESRFAGIRADSDDEVDDASLREGMINPAAAGGKGAGAGAGGMMPPMMMGGAGQGGAGASGGGGGLSIAGAAPAAAPVPSAVSGGGPLPMGAAPTATSAPGAASAGIPSGGLPSGGAGGMPSGGSPGGGGPSAMPGGMPGGVPAGPNAAGAPSTPNATGQGPSTGGPGGQPPGGVPGQPTEEELRNRDSDGDGVSDWDEITGGRPGSQPGGGGATGDDPNAPDPDGIPDPYDTDPGDPTGTGGPDDPPGPDGPGGPGDPGDDGSGGGETGDDGGREVAVTPDALRTAAKKWFDLSSEAKAATASPTPTSFGLVPDLGLSELSGAGTGWSGGAGAEFTAIGERLMSAAASYTEAETTNAGIMREAL